ncbi:MAG: hypothetical protein Q7J10_05555 [Methanosarcinaceae archaeon]|nr:hypothetical protein [Methanosarcinaceae archaeon]
MTPDLFSEEERYRAFQVDCAEWDVNTSKKRTRSEVKQNRIRIEPVFDSPSPQINITDIVIEDENENEKPKVDDFWLKHVK